jgi:DnaJ like chaperone protein
VPNKFSFGSLIDSISKMISEDEVAEKKHKQSPQQQSHEEEIQNAILVLAAAVIKCDRNFNGDTEQYILQFLIKHFGAGRYEQQMKSIAGHIEIGAEPFIKISCKELKMLTTHDSRLNITGFLFGVANADDFINAKETRCIHRIATYLGVSDKDFKEIRQSFISENNPYKILGLEEGATLAQVRTAYRKMVLKFHPDKRGAKLTEAEANFKFREIQRAYEIIKVSLTEPGT